MKRTIIVRIEKELEIELMPSVFGNMTEAEYLESFCKDLWKVESMDDVIKYAARAAATGGEGYQVDGLGLIGSYLSRHPRVPDVKVREISEDVETEIVGIEPCDCCCTPPPTDCPTPEKCGYVGGNQD